MLLPLALALAADVPIEDVGDAVYLEDTGRPEQAADWYLAHLDERLAAYMRVISRLPSYRTPALRSQVEAWQAAHPDDTVQGPLALAMAHAYVGEGHSASSGPFSRRGPWCEPAQEALRVLPEDGTERYQVLQARAQVARACAGSDEETQEQLEALALSGEAGPYVRAWFGAKDTVDADDIAALKEALSEHPWRLARVTHYFADDREGPALDDARAFLLDEARSLARSERPAYVHGAILLLWAAEKPDEVQAAREHLAELDPANERNLSGLQWLRNGGAEERPSDDAPPEPSTLLDPVQRLAALREAPVPKKRWARVQHWSAIADAAEASGDEDAALDALRRLWPIAWGTDANLRYARATVAAGRDLRKGAKAADHAVAILRDPKVYFLASDREEDWRADLADALDARALVAEARGRRLAAADDLEEALLLDGPDPERLLRLGLIYPPDRGAPLLGRALSQLPDDAPGVDEATERVTKWLADQPGWRPDAATFIATSAPPEEEPAEPDTVLDNQRFVDLEVQIDGETQRLFDIEGPIVLDVWATWCGPCMQSLPHLDTLARRHEGEVTFVAVSVDSDMATADRYLQQRGEHRFTPAFLGRDGMKTLGIPGIPAMFVFDAEHRLVAKLSGWGPGSTHLDDAVDDMLAREE